MGIDRSVASGTSEILVLPVRNVEVGLRVAEFLGQTKVDNVDLVAALSDAHQKVVWFDVAVDKVTRVNVLDAGDLRMR